MTAQFVLTDCQDSPSHLKCLKASICRTTHVWTQLLEEHKEVSQIFYFSLSAELFALRGKNPSSRLKCTWCLLRGSRNVESEWKHESALPLSIVYIFANKRTNLAYFLVGFKRALSQITSFHCSSALFLVEANVKGVPEAQFHGDLQSHSTTLAKLRNRRRQPWV